MSLDLTAGVVALIHMKYVQKKICAERHLPLRMPNNPAE
jgi:hypothetical protein